MNQPRETQNSSRRQLVTIAPGHLRAEAPAKINLNLLVGPLRDDGFHSVDSYVVKLAFCDSIELKLRTDGRICLVCDGFDCGADDDNLAMRAAVALQAAGNCGGADISLAKRIPPGKGLGGGSSDAAAVLLGLNELWSLGMSLDELAEVGASLGSDVPLFLRSPAARMTGRGEHLQPVTVSDFHVVLCLPDASCPTGQVYRAFDEAAPDAVEQLDAEVFRQPPSAWRHMLVNQLAPAAHRMCAPLDELRRQVSARIAQPVHLTGSGSAMFILCDSSAEAAEVCDRLDGAGVDTVIAARNPW